MSSICTQPNLKLVVDRLESRVYNGLVRQQGLTNRKVSDMACVHCGELVGRRDYWYYSEKLPIHTACIGYLDAEVLATLFSAPPNKRWFRGLK